MFRQKDANGIANSEDPHQTAPLGVVCFGSALFAQTYLSENGILFVILFVHFVDPASGMFFCEDLVMKIFLPPVHRGQSSFIIYVIPHTFSNKRRREPLAPDPC